MNYFELYELPISFIVDQDQVKKKFLELSKKFHPDFFVNEGEAKQQEVLEKSTMNTRAFQALSDFDKRMQYILELKQLISEGERYELSPVFLMDMMDINEALMDLENEKDQHKIEALRKQVTALFEELYDEVRSEITSYRDDTADEDVLKKIKDYYYRKKYLLRIQRSLDTFAARS
ncbi:MAG: Fe-S protein assembly co-chaperone HscB [Chitinophagaceae bacterium]|nr:Fe-S protein assembly co-chaperone HscB [Chitinophagaceae bacterium]